MFSLKNGSIRLFRVFGIEVFLHWSWLLVAFYQIGQRAEEYPSLVWNVAEYLSLFLIVLLHEFGHSLACRQVGGRADRIVLWPLGGVAYVSPPPRPGAMLWSIAAGPLVNVVLLLPLGLLEVVSRVRGWEETAPNAHNFIFAILVIDVAILVFNLIPIYPLDGGQILRSLLWFVIGPVRSLFVAVIFGFVGAAALLGVAIWMPSIWTGIIAVFIFMSCRRGWLQARALARATAAERREETACPSCQAVPPVGAFWVCSQCRTHFDTFATQGNCPNCSASFPTTQCLNCGKWNPLAEWTGAGSSMPPPLPQTK